jgi:hypothetical protein
MALGQIGGPMTLALFHNLSLCDRCHAVAALRYGIAMPDCFMIAVTPVS